MYRGARLHRTPSSLGLRFSSPAMASSNLWQGRRIMDPARILTWGNVHPENLSAIKGDSTTCLFPQPTMSASLEKNSAPMNYCFVPAGTSDKRSPCPALNALANHGYLPRQGTEITFTQLLHAVKAVYNLSLPLALLLTLVGFLTCAKFSVNLSISKARSDPTTLRHMHLCNYRWRPSVSWTLNLSDLSARGWNKIAHDASLVHVSGIPSHFPDPALVSSLLGAASHEEAGITLDGLAAVHVSRERSLPRRLSGFHEQVALGECALGWLVMRNPRTGVIELDILEQWFGGERLPEGWWDSKRPVKPVGLFEARQTAGKVKTSCGQMHGPSGKVKSASEQVESKTSLAAATVSALMFALLPSFQHST
ncbi:hypothetical protein MVEN_01663600 [Mycena venus]|uniref:Heme haloperoxidase family profile domain-containing protein n=1 Tax=Mycena venus TaxID=2733690 RepID=A0A8H6XPB7_9AGAR|nr:hypothetical protein MVEN_01663600 [Mycena venus]